MRLARRLFVRPLLLPVVFAAVGCHAEVEEPKIALSELGSVVVVANIFGDDDSPSLGVSFGLPDAPISDPETCEAIDATAGLDGETMAVGAHWKDSSVSFDLSWIPLDFSSAECLLPAFRVSLGDIGGEEHEIWLSSGGETLTYRLFVPTERPELEPEGELEFHDSEPVRFLLAGVDITEIDDASWLNNDAFPREDVDLKTELVEDGMDAWLPARTDDSACDEYCHGTLSLRVRYSLRNVSCDGFLSCGGDPADEAFYENVRWYP